MLKMIKYTQTSRKEDFMLDPYLNHLEVLDLYCQNDYQEIYTCKHEEENAYYLLNIIGDKEIFYGTDLKELKKYILAIKEIKDTDDGIVILTKHYFYNKLSEHLRKENMTLTMQINSVTYLIETLSKLKTISYGFIVSLFNYNNLVIDDSGNIKLTGILKLNSKVINSSREDALLVIANAMHMIFTGEEIKDNSISKGIPPDIERIIINCIKGDYFRAEDLVTDFKTSNIYELINPEKEDIKRVARMRKGMTRKRITYKLKTKGLLAILLLIPVIVWGSYSLLKVKNKSNNVVSNIEQISVSDNIKADGSTLDTSTKLVNEEAQIEDIISYKENMDKFFNEDLIMSLNENSIAKIDYSRYHRGEYSLKAFNDKSEKSSFLVGYIDLQDDNFAFVKDRTVNLSLWLNSDVNTDSSVTLKLGFNDKILTQVTKKVNLVADNWVLHNIEITTKSGQYIKIYLNTDPNNTIWIDTIDIDILK